MSRFPPMYLNNEENNIVSSILEEEVSELKDATFSTQSNISMQENFKSFQSRESKSQNSLFPSRNQNLDNSNNINLNQFSKNSFQKENYQIDNSSNLNLENVSDMSSKGVSEKNQNEGTYKKYDINTLKSEVDNLMLHVRETSKTNQSDLAKTRIPQPFANQTPNLNTYQSSPINDKSSILNQSENNFSRNNSSTQSPFMFQAGSDNQKQSNQKNQNYYENTDLNSSIASNFSNKWQNYDVTNNNSNSSINSNKSNLYYMPHVEFPDFQSRYAQTKSPFAKFKNRKYYDEEEENENAPFVLPQAKFPDTPKVLQYRFSRKPDSSKQDMADLDRLRKENFNLKAEMLKLEKRLQLEEEEHKKLINSLEKSERIRAEYRARIEQQNK